MKKEKFRIGDIVQVVNPDKRYANRENVINKVARIVKIYDKAPLSNNIYVLEFIDREPEGVRHGAYGTTYNKNEIKKLNKMDAFRELI
jgi:hypothetical protein